MTKKEYKEEVIRHAKTLGICCAKKRFDDIVAQVNLKLWQESRKGLELKR